ncbi:MAG TPA: OmpA family protein [Bryobacteraceae bacterium]|nr:OmpA family protein [Bryobacteraceae bacterium]
MRHALVSSAVACVLCAVPGVCQETGTKTGSVPIYRVTVVERNVDAVNYQYRSGPTKIDFRGTVLLSAAKGDATVESERGRTEIDAKFEKLTPPARFGREYLTYVLWAVSPEGAPHNLGELVPNGSNDAHLHVTTELQAFGMIVTAEPYSAVRQPSDVVVLENQVRPDTVGRSAPIQAKYELMPRGHYTWDVQDALSSGVSNAPKVSMNRYEAILEVYQAQNAIGVARAANAEQYAPNTLAKAQQELGEAQRLEESKSDTSLIVQSARAAAQTAEDARVISERRMQDEKLAKAQQDATTAQQAKAQADAAAQQARIDADAARAQAEAERAAHQRAEADAALARASAAQAQADRVATVIVETPKKHKDRQAEQTGIRSQMLERLNGIAITRDTPRGLVVTLPDSDFAGPSPRAGASSQIAQVAAVVSSQPGLRVEVEGHSDSAANAQRASERASMVRNSLVSAGLANASVTSQGFGDSRPMVSNTTEAGRTENRRVEIVISGDAIGSLPFWDRTYSLSAK